MQSKYNLVFMSQRVMDYTFYSTQLCSHGLVVVFVAFQTCVASREVPGNTCTMVEGYLSHLCYTILLKCSLICHYKSTLKPFVMISSHITITLNFKVALM